MSDREHILIAVPALDYTISASIGHLFSVAQKKSVLPGKYRFSMTTVEGVHGHDFVRNSIAKLFLEGPFDRLWMIDDDIVPQENVFDILDVDADIVAPLMPTLKWDVTDGVFNFNPAYAAGAYDDINDISTSKDVDISGGGAVPVDMVGTGCTVIRRSVLEDARMRYSSADLDEPDPPAIFRFQKKSNGGYRSGEDEDFCVRARRIGYSVALHTGIEVGHLRLIDIAHIFKMKKFYEAGDQPLSVANAIK